MKNNEYSLALLCDFYELTMGNGYFNHGYKDRICYFDVFFRRCPDNGGFAIAAGLEQIILKAMGHEPGERYETATKMLADLDEFRKNPGILFDYNTPPLDAVTEPRLQTLGRADAV